MKNFKEFYQSSRGKAILFFGFYLVFFIFLAFYLQKLNEKVEVEEEKKSNQEIVNKVYNIKDLYNYNFDYEFIISDNGDETRFSGTREKVDYEDFANKYFLIFTNINQLIKKSKLVSKIDNMESYEITNETLNELLETTKENGINKITEIDDEKKVQIILDLSSFMEKESYVIKLNYMVGGNNE